MSKKRRRKRRGGTRPEPAQPEAPARPAPRRRGADERPPAPWGSFPLVELTVLVAMVLLVGGFVTQGQRGMLMLAVGLVLGSLAGLELSIREHFAGYRSHTLLLAGTAGVLVVAGLFALAALAPLFRLALGALVFAASFWALREAFRRRSGGLTIRVGGFRG